MSITAARIGRSPVTVDWSHLVSPSLPKPDPEKISAAWTALLERFKKKEVGFYEAPLESEISQIQESVQLAHELRARGVFTDCLFLGIGGSALGPSSLLSALTERTRPDIRFHFIENPDPFEWTHTLKKLLPDSTLVCVVTKSGTTFETMAQFLCAMEWMTPKRLSSHCVAITDPEKGELKGLAREHSIPTLHVHPSVGGRFSIFTPVGIFAGALAGLDMDAFLQGAREVREWVDKTPLEKNALFLIGDALLAQAQKRPIHVCMPYSTRLRSFGDWFVQLWGESLGKDGKGFTPLACVGATDQHSILQLLRDGPDDKVTTFLSIDEVPDPVTIPRPGVPSILPTFRLLQGHSLQALLQTEYRATAMVLTKRGRPNLQITLDRLDERSLGALYFSFCVLTAFTGTLWGVNPFDQPGVEEGKIYIREALSNDR